MKKRNRNRFAALFVLTLMAIGLSAHGHETDQFTLPAGRQFADIGDYFSDWAYQTIDRGVKKTNKKIEQCLAAKRGPSALAALHTPDEIVRSINSEFPNAYDVIEGLEGLVNSKEMKGAHPGAVIGYKEQFTNIFQHVHFPLDPRQLFRLWHASTFKAYGVYLGSDKVGHFTDMGMHYFKAYSEALRKGKTETEAVAAAVKVGTDGPIFSERGMVGYLSAGAYSNADLVANYLGFLFYKNMTDPVMLKGQQQQPMLVRDGNFWKIAPHVRPDSDFFENFFCDHLNEAFNPSHFEASMRDEVRKAVRLRTEVVLARFCDVHGNRRPREFFDSMLEDFRTYYGQEYGHKGISAELVAVGNSCYHRFNPASKPGDRDTSGNTPLHAAAVLDDREGIRRLLLQGADVNAQVCSDERYSSEWGNTPLHYAARDGHLDAAQLLIQAGAHVTARNNRGQSVLHRAGQHADVAMLLLNNGAVIDVTDDCGKTPLHWAAMDGTVDVIEVLLGKGANIDSRDNLGESPLHAAARLGNLDSVSALLRRGANPNAIASFGTRPIHLAAAAGHPQVVSELLLRGATIESADEFGWTALHDAANKGHDAVVKLLLSKNANSSARNNQGCTPLHLAARSGRPTVADLLLSHGTDLNARNNSGATPLHDASAKGQQAIVQSMLAHGADANIKNNYGRTAIEIASSKGYSQLVALLRTGKPIVNAHAQ